MIIVSSVKKETVVGIMIVLHPLYVVDMEVENPFNGGNVESLELGSIIEKHNGNGQVSVSPIYLGSNPTRNGDRTDVRFESCPDYEAKVT